MKWLLLPVGLAVFIIVLSAVTEAFHDLLYVFCIIGGIVGGVCLLIRFLAKPDTQ